MSDIVSVDHTTFSVHEVSDMGCQLSNPLENLRVSDRSKEMNNYSQMGFMSSKDLKACYQVGHGSKSHKSHANRSKYLNNSEKLLTTP